MDTLRRIRTDSPLLQWLLFRNCALAATDSSMKYIRVPPRHREAHQGARLRR